MAAAQKPCRCSPQQARPSTLGATPRRWIRPLQHEFTTSGVYRDSLMICNDQLSGSANTIVDIGAYEYSKPLAIQYTSRPIAWSTHTVANRTQYEVQTSVNGIDNWQFFTYLSKDDMQLIPSDDGRYYYRVRAITTNGAHGVVEPCSGIERI